jgi:hypothetical protein
LKGIHQIHEKEIYSVRETYSLEKDVLANMVIRYPERAIPSEQIRGTDFEILFLHRFFSPKSGL